MKEVRLIADGSCIGNPGPGGWACVLRCGDHERMLTGGDKRTTNNRMELRAVIEGLRALNEPCRVEVITLRAAARKMLSVVAAVMCCRQEIRPTGAATARVGNT